MPLSCLRDSVTGIMHSISLSSVQVFPLVFSFDQCHPNISINNKRNPGQKRIVSYHKVPLVNSNALLLGAGLIG